MAFGGGGSGGDLPPPARLLDLQQHQQHGHHHQRRRWPARAPWDRGGGGGGGGSTSSSGPWPAGGGGARPAAPPWARPLAYGALNIASASGIVFANKLVMGHFGFHFTAALTWVHTLFTLAGMRAFLAAGLFSRKQLPARQVLPLAAAYVGYIVLCNLSLRVNSVGFYQVMKIAVAPTVMGLELLFFGAVPPPKVVAAVLVVCCGIAIATVSDARLASNAYGLAVGLAATVVTALYQIWAGSKQKELGASSMQLLHAYTPQAAVILGLLVPLLEPIGWPGSARGGGGAAAVHVGGAAGAAHGAGAGPGAARGAGAGGAPADSLLGYHYTPAAVAAIVASALLGLLVSLSTFLVIGCTSSLTYNVVGHLKTVIILAGGCMLFGDDMPPKKLLGVCVAMAGIVWYTQLKMAPAPKSPSKPPLLALDAKDPLHSLEAGTAAAPAIPAVHHSWNGAAGAPAGLCLKPAVSVFVPPLHTSIVQRPNR